MLLCFRKPTQDLIERALAEDVGVRRRDHGARSCRRACAPGARIEQKQPGRHLRPRRRRGGVPAPRSRARVGISPPEGEWLEEPPAPVRRDRGRCARAADRRAGRAQLPPASVGDRDRDRRVRRELSRGSGVEVLDTRKTIPGLRELEKQAVAAGGGRTTAWGCTTRCSSRTTTSALAGGIGEAVRACARAAPPGMPVEVECASRADVARRSRPVRDAPAARQHDGRGDARRRRARRRARRSSRPRAASRRRARGAREAPGYNSCPWARSPIPPPLWTSR